MGSSEQNVSDTSQPSDPRLQPTPDYGTLGPGSDIPSPTAQAAKQPPVRRTGVSSLLAVLAGIVTALVVSNLRGSSGHLSGGVNRNVSPESVATGNASPKDLGHIDSMRPQAQAETLLELAVSRHSDTAVDQISSRVNRWQGQIKWNPQLANLTTAALNSNDMRVRQSGIEVQLAAYGLGKDSSTLNTLIEDADSPDHSRKIWALWSLGAMANRGVEAQRVTEILISHLHDADEDSRRWAVEALALVGSDETINPLLATMHDDPSPSVRERAACSLAESGMLSQEQRYRAVSRLIDYSEDPALDAQTHIWAFQALSDITGEHLPNDSNAWRQWYSGRN